MTVSSKNNVIAKREQMFGYDDQGDRLVVEQTGIRVTMFY
jgi:hypothetical protein